MLDSELTVQTSQEAGQDAKQRNENPSILQYVWDGE